MKTFLPQLASARRLVQASGPYLLLEILLPGGTLLALLLLLYRRRGARLAPVLARLLPAATAKSRHGGGQRRAVPFDIVAWARSLDAGCPRARDGLEALAFAPAAPCPPARQSIQREAACT